MFGGILLRSIFGELLKVFLLSLVGITTIVALAVIVAEASKQGLGPTQMLMIVPLVIPSMLPYIIPTTTLFSACIVYGRLAHDNEILAIKAAGVNVLRIVRPALLLGALASAATLVLYHEIIPQTHHVLRTLSLNDIEEGLYMLLKRDKQIMRPEFNYSIFVKGVQGRRLIDAVFKRRDDRGRYDIIATAREAELRYDANNRKVLVHMRHAQVQKEGEGQVYFENHVWEVPLPNGDKSIKIRPREMTRQEIYNRRAEVLREIDADTALIALAVLGPPGDLGPYVENLRQRRRSWELELNSLNAELQMRPALALGCVFFVLVGCPVGIWFSRSDYLSAFITCFLPIICLYYPILLCGTNLAKDGRFPPGPTIWAANAVMGVIALGLFRRLLKH